MAAVGGVKMPTATDTPNLAELPVLAYARLLRQVHSLIREGRGDTPEAELLADQMDVPWLAMTDEEQARMRGLSIDLYALAEPGSRQVAMSAEELRKWQEQAAVVRDALFTAGDVDAALAFLRRPFPLSIPRWAILFLQARYWERLGDLETALVFMQEAEKLDPHQAISVLTVLQALGREGEAKEYADRIVNDPGADPDALYLAAAELLRPTREMRDAEAKPVLERIIAALNRALHQVRNLPPTRLYIPDVDRYIAPMLGLCLERLGRQADAARVYDEALARYPNDPELLTFRGLMRIESDPAGALRDSAKAAQLGAASAWPYFILARYALLRGMYGEALRQAIQASRHQAGATAQAEIYELIAIAQAQLGQPADVVIENFERACALDPKNERIRRNRELARRRATSAPPQAQFQRPPSRVPPEMIRRALDGEVAIQQDWVVERHAETALAGVLAA
jgi:tetratricopeptide (TPR) repeat protein